MRKKKTKTYIYYDETGGFVGQQSGLAPDDRVYVRDSSKSVRHVKWGRILVTLIVLSAIVCGGVLWFSRNNNTIRQKARTFYFVQTGSYVTATECAAHIDALKKAGGAGYVYNDGQYRAMAAVYLVKADAESVQQRLVGEGYSAEVFALSSAAVKVHSSGDKTYLSQLADIMAYPIELMRMLYDLSIALDKAEISQSLAMLRVQELKDKTIGKMNVLSGKEDPLTGLQKSHYAMILSALDEVKTDMATFSAAARIKYCLCALAVSNYTQTLEVAKL